MDIEEFSSPSEGGEFLAKSRQISASQIPFEAVETIFRRVLARTHTKISRGAFGGQHFQRQQQEASRAREPNAPYSP